MVVTPQIYISLQDQRSLLVEAIFYIGNSTSFLGTIRPFVEYFFAIIHFTLLLNLSLQDQLFLLVDSTCHYRVNSTLFNRLLVLF